MKHTHNGLFYEDPAYCGADSFALRVTYWKDSVLNFEYQEPGYPIVYSLAHFQNAAALQMIGAAMKYPEVEHTGLTMKRTGIETLWNTDHFVTAIDNSTTIIDTPSSDSLHSLAYLEHSDLPHAQAKLIQEYSQQLETKAGYLPAIAVQGNPDPYHTQFVWPFEQAFIHIGARKHSLPHVAAVSHRVTGFMGDRFWELLDSTQDFAPAGNPLQLFSVGAYYYLTGHAHSLLAPPVHHPLHPKKVIPA